MSKIPPAPFWSPGDSSEWEFWYNLVYKKLVAAGKNVAQPPIWAPLGDSTWLFWFQNAATAAGNVPPPPIQSEGGSEAWRFWYQELGAKVSAL